MKLYSRAGNDLTYRFPLIVEAKLRSRSCIIDGEAVACSEDGIACFDHIRYRRHDDSAVRYSPRTPNHALELLCPSKVRLRLIPGPRGVKAEALNASRRFDGPTRVRTSVAAIAIVSVIPAVLTAVLSFTFAFMFVPPNLMPDDAAPIFLAALPAQIFLTTVTATIVPSAILILSTHHIARAIHRSRGIEYACLGSLMSALCSIVVAPFTPVSSIMFLLVPALIYGAIMGALYRRFAGIEPMPLPEPVIVTDENTLVPADHSSRQGHGVVFTG